MGIPNGNAQPGSAKREHTRCKTQVGARKPLGGRIALKFYGEADKTTLYSTGVTINGTAGQAGAYTELVTTDTLPTVLHYNRRIILWGYSHNRQ